MTRQEAAEKINAKYPKANIKPEQIDSDFSVDITRYRLGRRGSTTRMTLRRSRKRSCIVGATNGTARTLLAKQK